MRLSIKGLEAPHIVPANDGKLEAYAILSFPDGERGDILVSLMNKQGQSHDDIGKVKAIVKAIEEAGLDIVPNNELMFSTLTPQEAAIGEHEIKVIERKPVNG